MSPATAGSGSFDSTTVKRLCACLGPGEISRGRSSGSFGLLEPRLVAAQAVGGADVEAHLRELGRSIGPPWQAKHKLAAAAAIAATRLAGSRR